MVSASRPLGVTIIGILYLLGGLLLLIGGIGSAGILDGLGLPGFGAFAGILLVVVAFVDIAIGIGCFQGWGWVWTVALIFAVINILTVFWNWWVSGHSMGGLFSAFLGIIIPLIIIWYLYKDNVKAFFGKA
jgi:hypothetical protein